MTNTRALRRSFFTILLAVGCSDSTAGGATQGDSEGISAGTGDATTGEPGEDESTSGSVEGSTGGEGVCETVLCGVPAICCSADESCVLGVCMPACDSGVRCGAQQDVCCDAGQVCLAEQCATPTGPCLDSYDCELGEFCEPTLQQCLPQLDPVTCQIIPEFEDIEVVEKWSYTDAEVISIPVVADIDGDGAPDVVLNRAQLDGAGWNGGGLVALDGQTGAVKWVIDHDPVNGQYGSHGRSTIGLSDVNGDGLPDIVYAGRPSGSASPIRAVDGFGNFLWTAHDAEGSTHTFNVVNGAPAFGNFDGDDEAEIVFGASLIDNDGLVVWDEGGNGATYGTNGSYTGGISAVVDLTGDGYPEIVSGRHAWSVEWVDVPGDDPQVTVTQLWDAGAPDGYPAIADLDLDGKPEVVLVANGTVRVLDGATGEAWCGVDPSGTLCAQDPSLRTPAALLPGGGIGGPPTIADFDGDGRPEIGVAGANNYVVFDLYREDEDVVFAEGTVMPMPGDVYPRWIRAIQDQSSNATGSSVFDFQGDGPAEVVYADECYLRVYDGASGDVLVEIEMSDATIHEYPLVVDVDGDGRSEILVTANDSHGNCNWISDYTYRRGLYVFADLYDRWVGTRRVWTSHTYHVTNVDSSGNAPPVETDNWTVPHLNNYRQNFQGEGVFNAPDLTVDLNVELALCVQSKLVVVATVRNIGSLGAPAGVEVSLYQGTDATGALVGSQPTPGPLLPGQQAQLTWSVDFLPGDPPMEFFVTVDGAGAGGGVVAECDDTNNDASAGGHCPVQG